LNLFIAGAGPSFKITSTACTAASRTRLQLFPAPCGTRQHIFHAIYDFAIGRNSQTNPQKSLVAEHQVDVQRDLIVNLRRARPAVARFASGSEGVAGHNGMESSSARWA